MFDFEKLGQEIAQWNAHGVASQLVHFLLWTAVILVIAWLVRKGINRVITDNTGRYRARKAMRFVSAGLIILLAVFSFTSQLKYFSVAIGLLTAGVAFALQEVILSVAGWIAIFAAKMYKPGDRIELAGVKGDVIDIGVTRTTLMEIGGWVSGDNYNGRIVQLSNGSVFRGPVHNYSTDFPFVWDEIMLPLKYGSDIQLAQTIVQEIAEKQLSDYVTYARQYWREMVNKYLIEDIRVEPTVTLRLTDKWIELTLRFVVDYQKRRSTKHQLFIDIYNAFLETRDKVQFTSATFEVVAAPELRVHLDRSDE